MAAVAASHDYPRERPRPGPRPDRVSPVPALPKPRARIDAQTREQRQSAIAYLGFLGALILLGLLGWLFDTQTSTVSVAAEIPVEVSSAVEVPAVTPDSVAATVAPTVAPPPTVAPTTSTRTSTTAPSAPTSTIPLSERELSRVDSVFGDIAPKSVTSVGNGLFFAQNMMYRHTVTVYNDEGSLLKTINDQVDFADFGRPELGVARGAPVEAAATSDGQYVYVSNYAMYGTSFGAQPNDQCGNTGWDNSFLYRVDTATLEIDQVIEVGAVPKFLAVSPDDRWIVVSNWCSFDASIVDTQSGQEVARINMGRHPRGVAITSDSSTAYVTQMGGTDIAKISLDGLDPDDAVNLGGYPASTPGLTDIDVQWLTDIGRGPRSVIVSPDDSTLFVTLNGEGTVVKVDAATGEVLQEVRTGDAPRSMAISLDGEALYVVNYNSDTLSKILTASFEEVQELQVADKPIGITVDESTSDVWVSAYSGVLQIFQDQ